MLKDALFFDKQDHELLHLVNLLLDSGAQSGEQYAKKIFDHALHPHGIKELAVSNDKRIAYAVVNLLYSLEIGQAKDRVMALQALHDEVILGAGSNFRYNTGRVLIQIMKELVRSKGDTERQLKLAHDFRAATSGRRRVVRTLLRRYYLLEMPEEWNQITFDHHVHDANTKGRKSPTHLIMDAWIKGIRSLTVIYYNYVPPAAMQELMQAAQIMDILVYVGVEYKVSFRGRYVNFIWEPTGFIDYSDMHVFLSSPPMQHLLEAGREASRYQERYVFAMLEKYNHVHRFDLERVFGIPFAEISEQSFKSFVSSGQPSRLHLASLIHQNALPGLRRRYAEIQEMLPEVAAEKRKELMLIQDQICSLDPDELMNSWLSTANNSDLARFTQPVPGHDVPELLGLTSHALLNRLTDVRSNCRITLNLSGLTVEDVLEILYDCGGMVTHIELFNLKEQAEGKLLDLEEISALQQAINSGSPVVLKRLIHSIIRTYGCELDPIYSTSDEMPAQDSAAEPQETAGEEEREIYSPQNMENLEKDAEKLERCRHLTEILRNIPRFKSFYQSNKLGITIGSDSASRSTRLHGMGFVCSDTLPRRSQMQLYHKSPENLRQILPLCQKISSRITYVPRYSLGRYRRLTGLIRLLPGCRNFMCARKHDWVLSSHDIVYDQNGNLGTLGGFQRDHPMPGCRMSTNKGSLEGTNDDMPLNTSYLNTVLKNTLKVLVGFIPALLTFHYTQTWWVLAWFGPLLWFAITGLRNIVQAVLGGGGLSRSPLLRWNNFVSWSRLCDSLMFTGLSVPLLELVVRYWLLNSMFGINQSNAPLVFFTVVSTVNGFYIAGHNLYRGLQKEAIIGNLFRSVLAIPVSLAYNEIFLYIFQQFYPENAGVLMLQTGAIISKISSDTVAGIIEGIADRSSNMRMRHWDCQAKLQQFFDCFARLELLLPEEEDVLEILARPKDYWGHLGAEIHKLERIIIINSLDLMYFWFYQPRGKQMLTHMLREMTAEERSILCRSQLILSREHEVSQLFVDGIVGRNFARPLSFYLDSINTYLKDLSRISGINLAQALYGSRF